MTHSIHLEMEQGVCMATGSNWKCKECKEEMPPNYMLWNEICVFCWFNAKKWRGKTKKEVIIDGKN